ncbi:hypothetical protein INF70_22005, partial [Enterobacter cloacae complex sp. P4RS]
NKRAIPNSPDEIRDYALGAYWAQEMMGMISEKEGYGYHINYQQVLNGADDKMHNQLKVPQEKLVSVLKTLYAESKKREETVTKLSDNEGKKFLQQFSSLTGVKRDPAGFYYLIAEKGKGKISSSDTVAVAMRESLSNGKVIDDML